MLPSYDSSVFLNCPFDSAYRPLFEAVVFAVYDCGFYPRCALESEDSSEVRIEKINGIIRQCRLAIHDISRTQLDTANRLPRFNMPFEFGIFMGAKAFGAKEHRRKACVVLDSERYRYQKFLSDIAGQDIRPITGRPSARSTWCGTSSPATVRRTSCCRVAMRWWNATGSSAVNYRSIAVSCASIRRS